MVESGIVRDPSITGASWESRVGDQRENKVLFPPARPASGRSRHPLVRSERALSRVYLDSLGSTCCSPAVAVLDKFSPVFAQAAR